MLLGASNLTRAFPLAVALSRARLEGPIEVLAAHGRGRSYGTSSRFFSRELPGIDECGLWRALAQSSARPTCALLTDVGNDLAYGASVERIAGWLGSVLDRLAALGARTAMTRIPLAGIERLPAWRFHVVRGVFYPTRRIDWRAVRESARELDERMVALARERSVALVTPEEEWFGLDPIHVRRSRSEEAWSRILSAWGPAREGAASPILSPEDRRALRAARPEDRRLLGQRLRREQPSATLLDGTTVALY